MRLLIRESSIEEEKPQQVIPEQASPLQGLRHQLMNNLTAQDPEIVKRKLDETEEEHEPITKKIKKKKKKDNNSQG